MTSDNSVMIHLTNQRSVFFLVSLMCPCLLNVVPDKKSNQIQYDKMRGHGFVALPYTTGGNAPNLRITGSIL